MLSLRPCILCALLLTCSAAFGQKEDEGGKPSGIRPRLLRGPYLQTATPTGILIRWRTDASARSRVRFGTDPDRLDGMADDSALVTEHEVALRGLQPLTRYYYTIGEFKDTLETGPGSSFTTLPLTGAAGDYRIGIFGDCGNNSVNQRNVRDQFLKYLDTGRLNAWILVGDNAYSDGTDAEFQTNFFNIYRDNLLKLYPLFPAPGNHDYHDIEFSAAVAQRTHSVAYYQNFSVPENGEAGGVPSHTKAFYSYDVGNIHFLSLDSYGKEADDYRLYDTTGPQVQWIKHDLEANTNRTWVIAYWHHPPYTMGSHSSDKETELVKIRENFIRILERYGVDLVVCGHSHDYERSRLMKGYYGMEADFDSLKYNLSQSSGSDTEPYVKPVGGDGTVYVVTGSAGKLGGEQPTFPHNAMYFSDAVHGGASLLRVRGNRLDFTWICADGVVRDHFVMIKKT
ncbi:MAG TPA: metallophosphoesterase family protein [Dinghuibacter sp.]|uniref:purple acid phosphatase family protein n=1 Tax=Dinghuibacter sp. TaxID=2024697 RepID=UPI002BC95496|nr:metallophosphoesterase family protein [Dinghuibacter sp.]HTJ12586.1 metallophosphoesterase family protein [Dinghuibacter sp.]